MTTRPTTLNHDLTRLGLDPSEIQAHELLLKQAVIAKRKPTFKIIDTCRLSNGGILPLPAPPTSGDWARGYLAFVLAAGAASRYSQPLSALCAALTDDRTDDMVASLSALAVEGALSWPLPPQLAALVAQPQTARQMTGLARQQVVADLQLAKALMPCVKEGTSFLAMKHLEHAQLPGLAGQLFTTPPGQQAAFARALATSAARTPVQTAFLPQGPELSTIRFYRDLRPVLEASGELSPVPAGHGALARLFPTAGQLFPAADALFIRNIDNIMGTAPAALQATSAFLTLHRQLLTAVRQIRDALANHQVSAASAVATELMGHTLPTVRLAAAPEERLWQLQAALFHSQPQGRADLAELQRLFARPVNLLGQVPNIHNDVGGTACFIAAASPSEQEAGSMQLKVCLEVPHASAADQQRFLHDRTLATHFNPGFCAVEMTSDPNFYAAHNRDFWLLAEKTYRGEPVMYYETVLYELLGNSAFANAVFVEVPRLVFNPHKTLRDAMGQQLARWLV